MTDLLWAGDERSGDVFSDAAVLAALIDVESAWLAALVGNGVAPSEAADDLAGLAGPEIIQDLARQAERAGNPVVPLLQLLRDRLARRNRTAADWLHRGLTSQDVLDTAMALCLRSTVGRLRPLIGDQTGTLARLAGQHRHTLLAGRTLTQHAVPISFGLKVATWLDGVLDARELLEAAARMPVQIGGAAGSLAAPTALAGSAEGALALAATTAEKLGLPPGQPWHTRRAPVTRIADAFVACTDAWGHIAGDILVAARPEVGELAEGRGGGSSTMPQKQNPVLAILVRRAALCGPQSAATLHLAAASAVDERPDGAWHAEWATVRTLARRTVTAGSQVAEVLAGLQVFPDRMAATLAAARPGIDAEQRSLTGATGAPYRGATDAIIDAALRRAAEVPR